jgi:hypothetical protein
MPKIKSFGCSFISGVDLGDYDPDPKLNFPYSQRTWPALIAQRLGLAYTSISRGGAGNLAIMHWLLSNIEPDDIAIINWTYVDRFDYVNTDEVWRSLLPNQASEHNEFYYRYVQSQVRDQLNSLGIIAASINYLDTQQIPYVMTYMDQLLTDRDRSPYHSRQSLDRLQAMVEPSLDTFEGTDFVTWSRREGFAISDPGGHPLEAAHQAAADLFTAQVAGLL